MTGRLIRIATRRSRLAQAQSRWFAKQLEALRPDVEVELVLVITSGDRIQDRLLREAGGKALFVKEIEEALLDGRADLAVHSLKDVPTELPDGLALIAVPAREDPRDALITSVPIDRLTDLPTGARVGTASMRRATLLLRERPDLEIVPLRGNVDTRLKKLGQGLFDAIVLAEAGLRRLGLDHVRRLPLEPTRFVPAAGQGALGIEAPSARTDLAWISEGLDDTATRLAVEAERAFLDRVGGGCHVPVAAYAYWQHETLALTAFVADDKGDIIQRTRAADPVHDGVVVELGTDLAETVLLAGGATMVSLFTEAAAARGAAPAARRDSPASVLGSMSEPTGQPLHGMRVLVTRSRDQASQLSERLAKAGAVPVELPTLAIRSVTGPEQRRLDEALRALGTYDWVVFTSTNGVIHTFDRFRALNLDARGLAGFKVAVIGTATADALRERGIVPDLVPDRFDAEGLLERLAPSTGETASVLILRAREARSTLVDGLLERGVRVDDVTAYYSEPPADLPEKLEAVLAQPPDLLTFASSKTVHNLVRAAGEHLETLLAIPVACIGPVTRRTAEKLGFSVVVQPERFTIDDLVHTISRKVRSQKSEVRS